MEQSDCLNVSNKNWSKLKALVKKLTTHVGYIIRSTVVDVLGSG